MSKFKFGVDNVPGSSQFGDTIYSDSKGVLTIGGIEEVPVTASEPTQGGGSIFFGGDYNTVVPLWQTIVAQSAGLSQSNYVIHYPNTTITPKGNGQTVINGDLNAINLTVKNTAHNGPFPDISPTVEAVPGADPSPWNGVTPYEPFYSVIDGVAITFGDTLINALGKKGYTIAGDTSSITYNATASQNIAGQQLTFTNTTLYDFTEGQDSEAIIQNDTIVGGSNTIFVQNNNVTNNISGNVTTVTVEAISTLTNLDNQGHLATSAQSNGIYGDGFGQPIISASAIPAHQTLVDMSASHNQITVNGNGDINNIYGNIATFTELAQMTSQTLQAFGAVISFTDYNLGGSNQITLIGNSTNTVSGDVGQTLLSVIGSDSGTSAQTAGFSSGAGSGIRENYNFGSNHIDAAASSGTNLIFGEGQSFLQNITIGNVDPSGHGWGVGYYGNYGGAPDLNHVFVSTNGALARNENVIAGNNVINGGTGDNTLVGDFGKFAITLDAGDVGSSTDAALNVPTLPSGTIDVGASTGARMINALFTLGDNTLTAKGAGTNTLFGGVETLEFNLSQGHILDTGHTGYGLVDQANHGINTFAAFSGDSIIPNPLIPPAFFVPRIDTGSTFTFGHNTLNATAASGNVTLIENTLGISDQSLQNFLTNPNALVTESVGGPHVGTINNNHINWGFGIESGGSGVNHFDFLVAANQDLYGLSNSNLLPTPNALSLQLLGNETITNLSHGSSFLEFYAPVGSTTMVDTVNNLVTLLMNNTTFSHVAGNTIIDFASGGKLTLDGVNISDWNDPQLAPSLVSITNNLGVVGTEHGIAFHF